MNNDIKIEIKKISDILAKVSDIKRGEKGRLFHNYYNNCGENDEIFSLFGNSTVVFWHDDNGVNRVYFYSIDEIELSDILQLVPQNTCLEYLTREEHSFDRIAELSGYELRFTKKRFTEKTFSEEERKARDMYWRTLRRALFIPGKTSIATVSCLDEILEKLYEVFDPFEAHICSRKELGELINNGWVVVSRDKNNNLDGMEIFKVENGFRKYGYYLWSGGGIDALANIRIAGNEAYENFLIKSEKKIGKRIEPLPSYGWVSQNNKPAIMNMEKSGLFFDGLFDYGYCK